MTKIFKIAYSIAPFVVCASLLAAALFIKPKAVGKTIAPPIFEMRDKYYGIDAPEAQIVWLAGNNGKVIRTTDGGVSWKRQNIPGQWHLQDIAAWDRNTAIAVGNDGAVVVTRDGGATWKEREAPRSEVANKLMRVRFSDDGRAWVVGEMGALHVSSNFGETWSRTVDEKDVGLTDIAFSGVKTAVAVGEFGTVLVTRNGGKTWEEKQGPTSRTLMAVGLNDMEGIAVGLEGVILNTRDAGLTWEQTTSPTNENLFGVAWDGAGWIIAGDKGVVLRSEAGGRAWETVELSPGDQFWRMKVVAKHGKYYLSGNSSGILDTGKWIPFTN